MIDSSSRSLPKWYLNFSLSHTKIRLNTIYIYMLSMFMKVGGSHCPSATHCDGPSENFNFFLPFPQCFHYSQLISLSNLTRSIFQIGCHLLSTKGEKKKQLCNEIWRVYRPLYVSGQIARPWWSPLPHDIAIGSLTAKNNCTIWKFYIFSKTVWVYVSSLQCRGSSRVLYIPSICIRKWDILVRLLLNRKTSESLSHEWETL